MENTENSPASAAAINSPSILEKGIEEIKNLLHRNNTTTDKQPMSSLPKILSDVHTNTLPKVDLVVENVNEGVQEVRRLIPISKIILMLLIAVLFLGIISLIFNIVVSQKNCKILSKKIDEDDDDDE
jgi:hypothetical protein